MKTLKPSSFGHWGLIGKKVVAKEANRVSAIYKCAIYKNSTQTRLNKMHRKSKGGA
jgi:hypothetical protein